MSGTARSAPAARILGAATLGLTILTALDLLRRRRVSAPAAAAVPRPASTRRDDGRSPAGPGQRPAPRSAQARIGSLDAASQAGRSLHASAALLAGSVLLDSGLEHYRGRFANPGMAAPLVTASLTVAAGVQGSRGGGRLANDEVYALAMAAGVAGTLFHAYNLLRRPGGLSWGNLFYAAPLGAPAALTLAGLLGLAARRSGEPILGIGSGRAVCALAAGGLAGSSAEAALLHFRGAYHHPAMWLPVSVPPVAAALLAGAAIAPRRAPRRLARGWLAVTAALGAAGVAFHAYGIARSMGGWRNWSQMILQGPPLPAPPGFTGVALAGLGALQLLEHPEEER
ncbi:MAG TPA: hypothetical protein VFF16_18340 [Telluria sp.]|nr:hypothetical protein [Telluria sp.]